MTSATRPGWCSPARWRIELARRRNPDAASFVPPVSGGRTTRHARARIELEASR